MCEIVAGTVLRLAVLAFPFICVDSPGRTAAGRKDGAKESMRSCYDSSVEWRSGVKHSLLATEKGNKSSLSGGIGWPHPRPSLRLEDTWHC